MKTQYTKTEDGLLRETKEVTAQIIEDDFSREVIDAQVAYATRLVEQAQEYLDSCLTRQVKADEKGVVAKADIAVEVVLEDVVEPVEEIKE